MKYYFITYQGNRRDGSGLVSTWNKVIKGSPMAFIKEISTNNDSHNYYYNFVVINTCEITEEEYKEYEFGF